MEMIAQYETPIDLLQACRGISVGGVPVAFRIVIVEFQGMRLRVQADQAAVTAFNDAENL